MRKAIFFGSALLIILHKAGTINLGPLVPIVVVALVLTLLPTLLDVLAGLEFAEPDNSVRARLDRLGPSQRAAIDFMVSARQRTWYGGNDRVLRGLCDKDILTRRPSFKPWRGLWRYEVGQSDWRELCRTPDEFGYYDSARAPFKAVCERNGHWLADPRLVIAWK